MTTDHGIAVHTDDLEPVQQRVGHRVQGVGRADEHDLHSHGHHDHINTFDNDINDMRIQIDGYYRMLAGFP